MRRILKNKRNSHHGKALFAFCCALFEQRDRLGRRSLNTPLPEFQKGVPAGAPFLFVTQINGFLAWVMLYNFQTAIFEQTMAQRFATACLLKGT